MLNQSNRLDLANDRLLWSSSMTYALIALSGSCLRNISTRQILEHDRTTCPVPQTAVQFELIIAVMVLVSSSSPLSCGGTQEALT